MSKGVIDLNSRSSIARFKSNIRIGSPDGFSVSHSTGGGFGTCFNIVSVTSRIVTGKPLPMLIGTHGGAFSNATVSQKAQSLL